MAETSHEKGVRIFAEIYGEDMARTTIEHLSSDTAFGARQSEWTLDFAFGEVWASEALNSKMRSAAVLGMLIATRATDAIRYQPSLALHNGLTPQAPEKNRKQAK